MTAQFMTNQQKLLSDMVTYSKYARYREDLKRREVSEEVLARYEKMLKEDFPSFSKTIEWAMDYAYQNKSVPSMRALQFAGVPIHKNNNRIYNCAYQPIDNIKAFSEIMYLLLGGTGVGYSVQYQHVIQLPEVNHVTRKNLTQYSIEDSIEGWADAVDTIIKAYLIPEEDYPIFDYSQIREKGEPIKTAGGFAPGPEPLQIALDSINAILYNRQGQRLFPIDVFDITNNIAQAVYSGGIRRSATIALFSPQDEDMLYSKSGEWWKEHPERAMANISAALNYKSTSKEQFEYIFSVLRNSNSGEPGFFWTHDNDIGTNPCAEISLRPHTFCNLTEVNIQAVEDQADFHNASLAATILGTFQASYTNLNYLRDIWKERTEKDSLIGVSLTGIAAYKEFPFKLEDTVDAMKTQNKELAEEIGINPAKRVTTIKPSGTASLYFGTSSGIHPFYAPYYIRRMRVNKDELLCSIFQRENPDFIEQDVMNQNQMVISIPVKAPEDSITSEEGAIDLLKRVRFFYNTWIKPGHVSGENTNNVSATIYVRKGEWDDVKRFLWENRDHYHGLTILPYDGSSYKQMPFEEIPRSEFERLSSKLKMIDFTNIKENEDHTNPSGEIACGGGSCEIQYL